MKNNKTPFYIAIAAGLIAAGIVINANAQDDAALIQAAANCQPVLLEKYSSEDDRNAAYEDCIDIEYRKLASPQGGEK